jgi:phage shock protein A
MIEAPDLSDLDPKDAKRIVLDYITSLRKTRAKREQLRTEFEQWERRHELATENGETELAQEALSRARNAVSEHERLGSEERELEVATENLKKQLRVLAGRPRRSINADALLSQLESVVGTDYETKASIDESGIEQELEQLKKRLSSESGE